MPHNAAYSGNLLSPAAKGSSQGMLQLLLQVGLSFGAVPLKLLDEAVPSTTLPWLPLLPEVGSIAHSASLPAVDAGGHAPGG